MASIGYTVRRLAEPDQLALDLSYTIRDVPVADRLLLEAVPCNFGGVCWYFRCRCDRRCGVLYNASGLWRCRHCGHITYTSSNESHCYDALFARMGYRGEANREAQKVLRRRYR